jgi:type III secretory pathway component EscS
MFKAINVGSAALKFVIAIVGCTLAIFAAVKWVPPSDDGLTKTEAADAIIPYVSGAVWICTIVAITAVVIAVLFGIYKFITQIKKNVPQLVGILAFAVILAIAWYGMANWDLADYNAYRGGKFIDEDPTKNFGLTQGLLSLSDGGVWALFILIPLTIILAVVAEVVNIFK